MGQQTPMKLNPVEVNLNNNAPEATPVTTPKRLPQQKQQISPPQLLPQSTHALLNQDLSPLMKAPSPTYAFQVSQLSLHEKLADDKANKDGGSSKAINGVTQGNNQNLSARKHSKKVDKILSSQRVPMHHSMSKDVLNEDMKEVYQVDKQLD